MSLSINGTTGVNLAPLQRAADVSFLAPTAEIATGIPNWVNRITVLASYSLSGTSQLVIQLGTGSPSTYVTTGYSSAADNYTTSAGPSASTTIGFRATGTALSANVGVELIYTIVRATTTSPYKWIGMLGGITGANNQVMLGGGYVTLNAPLTAVRLNPLNGTDNIFGFSSLIYE